LVILKGGTHNEDKNEFDNDGVAVYWDKYIDVIATPQGDIRIDDRDELDEAYRQKDLTKVQYDDALKECDNIISEMFAEPKKTEDNCRDILCEAMKMIENNECSLKLNI
jgi:predicted RNA-binding protein associated with RNAse of E/G family